MTDECSSREHCDAPESTARDRAVSHLASSKSCWVQSQQQTSTQQIQHPRFRCGITSITSTGEDFRRHEGTTVSLKSLHAISVDFFSHMRTFVCVGGGALMSAFESCDAKKTVQIKKSEFWHHTSCKKKPNCWNLNVSACCTCRTSMCVCFCVCTCLERVTELLIFLVISPGCSAGSYIKTPTDTERLDCISLHRKRWGVHYCIKKLSDLARQLQSSAVKYNMWTYKKLYREDPPTPPKKKLKPPQGYNVHYNENVNPQKSTQDLFCEVTTTFDWKYPICSLCCPDGCFCKTEKNKCPPGGPVISCFNTGTDGLPYTTLLFISPLEKKCTEYIFCSVDQL